jgi:hypothetical protein
MPHSLFFRFSTGLYSVLLENEKYYSLYGHSCCAWREQQKVYTAKIYLTGDDKTLIIKYDE